MKNAEIPARASIVLQALKTVAVAMIFTALALLLLAAFVTYGSMPEDAVPVCVTAATFICVFASGFAVSGAVGKKGWLSGLIAGTVYVLVILIVGWMTLGDSSVSAETLKMLIISVFSGIVGGILGINFKRKRKTRR